MTERHDDPAGASDFLLEIGTEELPSSACHAVLQLLPERVVALFDDADINIDPTLLDVMVSARRIAVLARSVPHTQTPRETVQRGPGVQAAFDEAGNPTAAAIGFARAKGVEVADLEVREEGGRRFVYYVALDETKPTVELLPDICLKIVRDMYFPKNMRWGRRDLRFARPVRWLVALYGDELIPFSIAGLEAGRTSRGHRWLGGPVEISSPGAYVDALRRVCAVVDQEEREALIRAQMERLSADVGLRAIDPMNKMAEVLFLVEWPTVLLGTFRESHLRLPPEVLIMAMQSHQRYFPLVDPAGVLSNKFLFAMNGDPRYAAEILAGNLRVLEGRLEDAEFSFDKDVATGIEEMARHLDRVVFHEKLGSMKAKTDRLVELTGWLADAVGVDADTKARALEAARLAKADQVSIMVREFADLEGVMGATYARLEGYPEEVAEAIKEQFLPDAADGTLPQTLTGSLLATAEKIDNIVAAFACGEPPTGSKDPYGLRRAATGMVSIALARRFVYDVRRLAEFAYRQFEGIPHLAPEKEVVPEAVAFILERLAKTLIEQGLARDTVEAVVSTSPVFVDLAARAQALDAARREPWWEDVVIVFTRPNNLATKLAEADAGEVDPALFEHEAERRLFLAWEAAWAEAEARAAGGDYLAAWQALARVRPEVDQYFTDVLVMTEDRKVQVNRLRQLARIADAIKTLADLQKLQA